jgi:hypothetical protein
MGNQPSTAWGFLSVMGSHLFNPKEVVADETFSRDSVRPCLFRSPEFSENSLEADRDIDRRVEEACRKIGASQI